MGAAALRTVWTSPRCARAAHGCRRPGRRRSPSRRRPGLGVARGDRRAPTDASRARTGDRCRHRGCARLRFAGARPGGVRRRRRARSRDGGRVPGGRGGPRGRSPPAPAGTGALALRDRRRRRRRDVRRGARPRSVGRPAPPRLAPRSGGSGRARDGAGRRAGVHVPRPGGAHRAAPQSRICAARAPAGAGPAERASRPAGSRSAVPRRALPTRLTRSGALPGRSAAVPVPVDELLGRDHVDRLVAQARSREPDAMAAQSARRSRRGRHRRGRRGRRRRQQRVSHPEHIPPVRGSRSGADDGGAPPQPRGVLLARSPPRRTCSPAGSVPPTR